MSLSPLAPAKANDDQIILELATQVPLPLSSISLVPVGVPVFQTASEASDFTQIQLETRMPHTSSAEVDEADGDYSGAGPNEFTLPPVDKGYKAWSFLVAAFFIEGIAWGFPNSFGVFLDVYLSDPTYANQSHASSLLPLIGPLSSGIIYCSGPVINTIVSRRPHLRKPLLWIGSMVCWISLLGASYTNSVKNLVFLQGVLYAIGGSAMYYPRFSYMSEWFVKRRGFANGVMFTGASAGGLILPLILPHLLTLYGPSTSLRILAIATMIILIPCLLFMNGRLPELRSHIRRPEPRGGGSSMRNRFWLKNLTFWVMITVNTVQGFGYFVPILWLPTFANAIHLTSANSVLALSLLNGSSVVGRLSLGYLSDKLNPWLLASLTLIFTSLSTFVLWGVLSSTFAGLLSFGIVYGALAGGWSSLWAGFLHPLASDDPTLATTLVGYLMFSQGIGNIFSTPISSALSSGASFGVSHVLNSHESTGFQVDNGRYEKMILYVGACFGGAALISLVGWVTEASKRINNPGSRLVALDERHVDNSRRGSTRISSMYIYHLTFCC
ncbi:MFS general substrate transporter [Marasmius fiardii PR-910]|nr:MFS general substrate transporter [Marasmius fiardii PR-910]